MKYNARLLDENYNVIKSFWFMSKHNVSEIELAHKDARQIADEKDYEYKSIQVSPKEETIYNYFKGDKNDR